MNEDTARLVLAFLACRSETRLAAVPISQAVRTESLTGRALSY